MEYGTIKIPREDYERHNERREAANLTWAEYIDGGAPDVRNGAEGLSDVDDLTDAVKTIEERTGRIERTLEELQQ
jgi:hypothetical protein